MIERLKQNWHPMPDQLTDLLIREKNGSTIRVVLFIAQKTLGFRNEIAQEQKGIEVPYSALTKVMSSASVAKGLKQATEKGYIIKLSNGSWKDWSASKYKLNFEKLQSLESKECSKQTLDSKVGNLQTLKTVQCLESKENIIDKIDKIDKIEGVVEFNEYFKDTFGQSLKPYRRALIEDFFRDPGISQELVCIAISKMSEIQESINNPGAYLVKVLSNAISRNILTVSEFVRWDIQKFLSPRGKEEKNHRSYQKRERGRSVPDHIIKANMEKAKREGRL